MSRILSPGTMSIAILAMFLGLVGAYGVRLSLRPDKPPEPPRRETVPVASANLPADRQLVLSDIALLGMTQQQLQERGWSLERTMLNPDQLIGRRLRKAIVQGEPFMTTDLYLEGAQEFQLRPGYAAVSIQVPLERGGFVARGTVVDVLFRARPRRAEDDRPAIPEVTVTLMEGVEVLSAERPLSSVSGQPRARNVTLGGTSANVVPPTTVVLEIAPEDANKLWAVEGHGDISLVSRNLSQMPVRRTAKRMTLEEVLGIESASAAPSPFVTEIYRGGQRSTQVFPPRPSS